MPASWRASGMPPARLHTPPFGRTAASSTAAPSRQKASPTASMKSVFTARFMALLLSFAREPTRREFARERRVVNRLGNCQRLTIYPRRTKNRDKPAEEYRQDDKGTENKGYHPISFFFKHAHDKTPTASCTRGGGLKTSGMAPD